MFPSSLPTYYAPEFKTSWDKEDLVGCGSFASVRLCTHKLLGEVAVKCFSIKESLERYAEVLEEMEREVNVLYRLEHKNIVKIIGTTKWTNCVGIIMEYVAGGNLEDFLFSKKVQDIPWPLRLRFGYEICDGLSHLHHHDETRAFVHGDMKPQNVLLTPDLQVKLADFGSVNIALAPGVANTSMDISLNKQHSSYYTAPEYLANPFLVRKPSMDVYSFAMIIYEILTKHRVFQQSIGYHHVVQVIIDKGQKPDGKHLQNVRPTLESNSKDLEIFEFLESIMMECWNFNAENRPDIRKVRNQTSQKLRYMAELQKVYQLKKLKLQEPSSDTTQISVKINLTEFSPPFQNGPMPIPSYLSAESQEGLKGCIQTMKEVKFAEHVMISYSWDDAKEKAHQTYYTLHDDGYDVWIDKEDMRGNIYEKMASAVDNAYVVLVFVSPNYEKSENCKREACLAADLKKRIIPIYIDENYRPKNWLRAMTAGKLYHVFGKDILFDDYYTGLLKDINAGR